MIKAIALDDEPPALEILKAFCGQSDAVDLVKCFTRSEEAAKYLANYPVDLLFLDINMPSISGIDFKKGVDPSTMVIFTTAYTEYAVEGFNVNAIDYLLKPFTVQRFLQATEKAQAYYQFLHQNHSTKSDHIMVRVDYSLIRINLNEILFIEGLDDYLKIHLQHQKPVVTRLTMKAINEKLPQSDFMRIHRSFTVPLKRIEAIRNKMVQIAGENLPIGSRYEAELYRAFNK